MNRTQLSAILGTTIKFKKCQQSKSTGSWSVCIDRQKKEKGFQTITLTIAYNKGVENTKEGLTSKRRSDMCVCLYYNYRLLKSHLMVIFSKNSTGTKKCSEDTIDTESLCDTRLVFAS